MRLDGYRQKNAEFYYRIHRSQLKPPYPVLIFCAGCGHGLMQINTNSVEVSNDIGLRFNDLLASDVWFRQRHTCGCWLTFYWVD